MKIAIFAPALSMGGVQKSLTEFVKHIDYKKHKIEIWVPQIGMELESMIPKYITIRKICYIEKKIIWKHPFTLISILWYYFLMRVFKNFADKAQIFKWTIRATILPPKDKYDIAISYYNFWCLSTILVSLYIRATKKYLWIHTDIEEKVSHVMEGFCENYDKIFTVSQHLKEEFLSQYPLLENKTSVFHNFIDVDQIRLLSQKGPTFSDCFNGTRILTIGRLSKEKGIDIAIKTSKILKERNVSFRWYVCGDGNEKSNLFEMIKEKRLEDYFVFLGNQSNPYHFLADCDIYVQTSRRESWCLTVQEAKVLCKPVISVDLPVIREQISNFENGIVLNSFDPIDLANAIERLLLDKIFIKNIKNKLVCYKPDSKYEDLFLHDLFLANS